MYSLSLLFCQFSSNTVSSPVYYSSFVSKNFPLLKKNKTKKNAWSQVTLEVKCAWWLAFVLHPISLFSFFCFDLPITQTFFDFPWRFDLPGVDCGNQGVSAACETWKLTETQYCGRHDIIFLRVGEGELHTFSAFINNVKRRGGSRIFFRRGCTRLLLYFNTNKPHSFFFLQNRKCWNLETWKCYFQ